ncbi:hypothetical protein [Pseudomonas sp. MH9.3]|uniref:hypothetical protein n=1 Tax=Pseudomonas sp. MH9.3 TaxID=3048630 RepID=UPI002AC9AC56|nr:hypothetical protein [Pseudomonas sp. MH9.3]MEB0105292.1 hypothetical protein [Pseudomonas sp. MH9.3]WPX81494.1 hypothetical protein RHM60_10410 [Pseudomonas sp. MH9.3]WQG56886.1 hypothetical protein RHM66_16295 [Pseudomonas sp. RTB3]
MKSTRRYRLASLGAIALMGLGTLISAQAIAAPYNPLSGDISVNIIAGAAPTGAVGLSTGPTGVERPVYFRPGSSDALFIGASNTLPAGCKPTDFKDDDGTTIPVLVKLDCNGKPWQAKLSKNGKIFSVKALP